MALEVLAHIMISASFGFIAGIIVFNLFSRVTK